MSQPHHQHQHQQHQHQHQQHQQHHATNLDMSWAPSSHTHSQDGHSPNVETVLNRSKDLEKTPSTPLFLVQPNVSSVETDSVPVSASDQPQEGTAAASSGANEVNLGSSSTQVLSGLPDPSGFKTPQELDQFWSPSVTLGNTSSGKSISHDSSRNSLTQQSLQPSNISSPISESTLSSAQPTPGPASTSGGFTFKNYSPTASVDGESLVNRQMVQSAIHTPSCLEDSHSSTSFEPMSQSLRVDTSFRSSTGSSSNRSSPSQSLVSAQGNRAQLSSSFRVRLGRFINFLSPKKTEEGLGELSSTAENEEFTEIYVSDLERAQQRSRLAGLTGRSANRGILTQRNPNSRARRKIEVGEECLATEAGLKEKKVSDSSSTGAEAVTSTRTDMTSDPSDVKVDSEESSTTKPDERAQESEMLKIANLPLSSRTSRSSSESSQGNGADVETNPATHPLLVSVNIENEQQRRTRLYDQRGLASSVPERGAFSSGKRTTMHSRSRSSNSDHTVLMVQERLQELVESENHSSASQSGESFLGSSTPVIELSGQVGPLVRRPTTLTVMSTDSTATLRLQSPPEEVHLATSAPSKMVVKPSSGANVNLQANSDGSITHVAGSGDKSSLSVLPSSLPSRFFVRRVSVCHRDHQVPVGVGQHLNQSSNQTRTTIEQSCLAKPSPVTLLDQFVTRGEVLHRGQFESIPLTELEGVDWNHFGGCPHSEEFGMMRSQVALLHSQLLFERHQCLQHAKRNRRLLSRARSSHQVAEKLYSLVRSSCTCTHYSYCED